MFDVLPRSLFNGGNGGSQLSYRYDTALSLTICNGVQNHLAPKTLHSYFSLFKLLYASSIHTRSELTARNRSRITTRSRRLCIGQLESLRKLQNKYPPSSHTSSNSHTTQANSPTTGVKHWSPKSTRKALNQTLLTIQTHLTDKVMEHIIVSNIWKYLQKT